MDPLKVVEEVLPPPPPSILPPHVVPVQYKESVNRVPMARRGLGSKGQRIKVLANHFSVTVSRTKGHFYQYSVAITYEDGTPVEAKGIGRKLLDKVQTTYHVELDKKNFAYDGEKSLFTIGALPQNKFQFTVVLDEKVSSNRNMLTGGVDDPDSPNAADKKRSKRQPRSKTYTVVITYATKIPLQAIESALQGEDSEHFQEAVRVLDIILRQHAAKRGCLLVRQSFFHNESRNFSDIGGGVHGCHGFHSSFRATQGGLSLNVDVSTTMTVHPGPVEQFLLRNQNVRSAREIDWVKAKRVLKSLRITVAPTNTEHKITGLSDKSCKQQLFSLKQRRDGKDEQSIEISVYDYFVHMKKIPLTWSADLPCINTGKPKRPVYVPLELCSLVSLQRYTKSLSSLQRASLVEKSRQGPKDRMALLTDALRTSNYNADPLLGASGVSMSNHFTKVDGRILPAPQLTVGNGMDFPPRDGRWNFNNKKLVEPATIGTWIVVNFSFRCDLRRLIQDLIRCGRVKGVIIEDPYKTFEENPQFRRSPPHVRVEKMFELIKQGLPGPPAFVLCILPDRKNSELYGPWKRKMLSEVGVPTQCIVPTKFNDQYLTNVMLKINAKMGGINSLLAVERSRLIPLVSRTATLIVGMDVSHGSPGRADVPSIAAVVSSRKWPFISSYRASVRTQPSKMEMVGCLFKKVSDTKDEGVFRELLLDFYNTSGSRKPEQIIIFRDGVSESQFSQVLNIELEQMIEACRLLDDSWSPKFMVVIAQKNHHTRFFLENATANVPPGTIVDNGICHPRNNDFYMCAHAGRIGTTRPTHYHVLYDELGFSADDLQELVHSLSYVYQRSTTAISIVAPICYAHLAAAQMSQFIKFDEISETTSSSSHGGVTSVSGVQIQDLPPLHNNVAHSMFFC
ncbi:translation initiation factor [Lithospermum erythrorhizon]|uniref:Translation initiation factor n=1 Tax=Lithospermum erythrorhizon TaxID=34254 RepID=A0AAV3RUZ4_LITER